MGVYVKYKVNWKTKLEPKLRKSTAREHQLV